MEGEAEYIRSLFQCPVYLLAGNNDSSRFLDRVILSKIGSYTCFLTHGHRYGVRFGYQEIREEAIRRGADWCFFGHTHTPYLEETEKLTLFNPGSAALPRRRGSLPTYGIVQIRENGKANFSIREIPV